MLLLLVFSVDTGLNLTKMFPLLGASFWTNEDEEALDELLFADAGLKKGLGGLFGGNGGVGFKPALNGTGTED